MQRQLAEQIAATLRAAGHRALFVGGCVRDLLLGDTPHDYDIATSARPEEVLRLFPHTAPVGQSFGVVLVMPDGRTPIEVATFRRDLGYTDRRRPDAIEYATEKEDASRRDFTINGLFFDPVNQEILDFVGGRADLETGVIRAIGDPEERIAEDRLRMLRAIRFAARFHFRIEARTFAAIRRHASSVTHVSAERIREEISKMLCAGDAAIAVELLAATGLLAAILPELDRTQEVAANWESKLLMLAELREPSVAFAMAALLVESGDVLNETASTFDERIARATETLARLRFSNRDTDQVLALLRGQVTVAQVADLGTAEVKRFLRGSNIADVLELHRLVCIATGRPLDAYACARVLLASLKPSDLNPEPLLGGKELIELGIRPGAVFRRILDEVETAQLEGGLTTRDEALTYIRTRHLGGDQDDDARTTA